MHARARTPRKIMANALQVVKLRATRLTDNERRRVLLPAIHGFKALRTGVATYNDWAGMQAAVTVALAIDAQGVVRGLQGHFAAGHAALQAIWQRATDGPTEWTPTALYFDELAALREAIHLHSFQLQHLSVSELHAARDKALRQTVHTGGRVLQAPAESLPQPIQESLL
ncbi:MAG: hypothetical protein AB7P37_03440 [Ramlibacter sp.]